MCSGNLKNVKNKKP